jgi:hypothetical protein
VGSEPTISVLERAKTVRASDRAAAAIGDDEMTKKTRTPGQFSYTLQNNAVK